jgi:hypothetical protein
MEKDRIFSAAHSCYDPNRHAACSKLLDQERSYKQELSPQSSIRNNTTQMTGGVYILFDNTRSYRASYLAKRNS